MTIRALVFDAYGTLFDTQSVVVTAEQSYPGKGELISQLWRLKQLEYTWLRGLLQEYEDFWAVARARARFPIARRGFYALTADPKVTADRSDLKVASVRTFSQSCIAYYHRGKNSRRV